MRILTIAIIALAASGAALAQTQPVVRVEVKPESVSVGEAAELKEKRAETAEKRRPFRPPIRHRCGRRPEGS